MDTVFETRDVLLALSEYMENHEDEFSEKRMGELQNTFDEIATDEVVLVRKGE